MAAITVVGSWDLARVRRHLTRLTSDPVWAGGAVEISAERDVTNHSEATADTPSGRLAAVAETPREISENEFTILNSSCLDVPRTQRDKSWLLASSTLLQSVLRVLDGGYDQETGLSVGRRRWDGKKERRCSTT